MLVAPFHGNTDQDTQRIDMSEPQQHTPSAPAAARREKPKYRGGAGADHVRATNTPAPVRMGFFFFVPTVAETANAVSRRGLISTQESI